MMGDIYKLAQTVLIWLGPEEPGDRIGLYLIEELCGVIPLGHPTDLEPPVDLYLSGEYDIPSHRWKAMLKFLRKPCFWRIWILGTPQSSGSDLPVWQDIDNCWILQRFLIQGFQIRRIERSCATERLCTSTRRTAEIVPALLQSSDVFRCAEIKGGLETPSSPVVE
jgi:hypothetical protein